MDGMKILETDMYHRVIMSAAAGRAAQIREEEREDLARRIRNQIVEAWNKK